MDSADLLLHPVRLRIIKAFLGDRPLTTTQLAAELDDVPAGSLYRHVALLTRAGLLHVVAEHRIRGAVERTYALRQSAARVQPGEAAAMTPEVRSRWQAQGITLLEEHLALTALDQSLRADLAERRGTKIDGVHGNRG